MRLCCAENPRAWLRVRGKTRADMCALILNTHSLPDIMRLNMLRIGYEMYSVSGIHWSFPNMVLVVWYRVIQRSEIISAWISLQNQIIRIGSRFQNVIVFFFNTTHGSDVIWFWRSKVTINIFVKWWQIEHYLRIQKKNTLHSLQCWAAKQIQYKRYMYEGHLSLAHDQCPHWPVSSLTCYILI